MNKERNEEIENARFNYVEYEAICDDVCEECAAANGFRKGANWADSHPSLELVERIINMAFDGWDGIGSFHDLAQSIKEKIENGEV
jgi:hypothetical protein